jgi:hypothetical protein
MLEIEGAVVTIDASAPSRRRSSTGRPIPFALKGDQGSLKDDVKLFVDEQKAVGFKDAKISRDKTIDGDHGRIETREVTVIHQVGWLQERRDWPGLESVVVVESAREVAGKVDREMRLSITSLVLLAHQTDDPRPLDDRKQPALGAGRGLPRQRMPRGTENAPANLAPLRGMAYNVMRTANSKDSMRLRRKVAARDDDFLVSLIAA